MKTKALPHALRCGPSGARAFRWSLLAATLLSLIAAFGVTPAGTQERGLTVDVANFTEEASGVAQVVLGVADEKGPVSGLRADAFLVELDGKQAPVTAVARGVDSKRGVSVVLALDVSPTMQGEPLEQAKAAARGFLNSLGPNDSVAIVVFGSEVHVLQPFTTDRAAASAVIERLGPSPVGGTKLYDATAVSSNLAAQSGAHRRAVVLLSDGQDNASGFAREATLAAAEPLGVPVFTIGLGEDIDWGYLEALAEKSGGRFAGAPTPQDLATLYQQVAELLRGQYVLTLDTADFTPDESGAASLRVQVTAGERSGVGQRAVCFRPTCIVLTGVKPGERLEGRVTINAQVISSEAVDAVQFFVDGRLFDTVEAAPYQITLEPSTLEDGDHTVEARARVAGATAVTATLAVQKGAASGGLLSGATFGIALLAALISIVGVAAVLFLRFRRGGPAPEPTRLPWTIGPNVGAAPTPEAGAPQREDRASGVAPRTGQPRRASGVLKIVSGPHKGATFAITEKPAGIGSGLGCLVRLNEVEDGREIAPEEARVWLRGDRLMLHELRRLTVTGSVGGRWAIIGPGEQFSIGPCTFEFQPDPSGSPAPPASEWRSASASVEPRSEPLPPTGRIWPREQEPPAESAPGRVGAQATVEAVPRFQPLRRTGTIWPLSSDEDAALESDGASTKGSPPAASIQHEPIGGGERAGPPHENARSSPDGAERRRSRWPGLPDIFKSPKNEGAP